MLSALLFTRLVTATAWLAIAANAAKCPQSWLFTDPKSGDQFINLQKESKNTVTGQALNATQQCGSSTSMYGEYSFTKIHIVAGMYNDSAFVSMQMDIVTCKQ